MPNWKIIHTGVGVWLKGDVVSEKQITDHPAMGLQRLIDLKAIEPTDENVHIAGDGNPSPEHTKGDNVDPGSEDTVESRAQRRAENVGVGNTGGPGGADAAARGAPPRGVPGAVRTTAKRGE